MNLLDFADGVGLAKTGGGVPTCGDHATQLDDGSTASPTPTMDADVYTPRVLWFVRDYANGGTLQICFLNTHSGTGALVGTSKEDAHPDYFHATTGTTSTGHTGRAYSPPICFDTGGHLWRFDAAVRIPVLSTSAQAHSATVGFSDAPTVIAAVDGAYVTIDSNANANFQCVTSANSVRTTTDSGVAAVANTWYRIVIDVSDVTNVLFRIYALGGSYPASATVTTTSNIPTGTARSMGAQTMLIKSAGTTATILDFWYEQISQDRLAA